MSMINITHDFCVINEREKRKGWAGIGEKARVYIFVSSLIGWGWAARVEGYDPSLTSSALCPFVASQLVPQDPVIFHPFFADSRLAGGHRLNRLVVMQQARRPPLPPLLPLPPPPAPPTHLPPIIYSQAPLHSFRIRLLSPRPVCSQLLRHHCLHCCSTENVRLHLPLGRNRWAYSTCLTR